jgi:hypothetical protein
MVTDLREIRRPSSEIFRNITNENMAATRILLSVSHYIATSNETLKADMWNFALRYDIKMSTTSVLKFSYVKL